MELYLLRHGMAVERGTPGFKRDADRPLTAKGKKQLKKVTRALKEMELEFDLIFSSPYFRAQETVEIVAKGLKLHKKLKFTESLTPEKKPDQIVRQLLKLKSPPEKVLLVGHEPLLGQIISLLTTGGLDLHLDFAKAGLGKLN